MTGEESDRLEKSGMGQKRPHYGKSSVNERSNDVWFYSCVLDMIGLECTLISIHLKLVQCLYLCVRNEMWFSFVVYFKFDRGILEKEFVEYVQL